MSTKRRRPNRQQQQQQIEDDNADVFVLGTTSSEPCEDQRSSMMVVAGRHRRLALSVAAPAIMHTNDDGNGNGITSKSAIASLTAKNTSTDTFSTSQQELKEREAMLFYQDLLPNPRRQDQVLLQRQQQQQQQNMNAGMIFGPYPVTTALLWAVHILYVVQWNQQRRRRRRRRSSNRSSHHSVTYRTLVEKKRYYRWWSALLSQYHPNVQQHHSTSTDSAANGESEAVESSGNSNLTVDMGHAPDDRGPQQQQQSTTAAAPRQPQPQPPPVLLGDWQALQEWTVRQSRALYRNLPAAWRESAAARRCLLAGQAACAHVQRAATVAGGKSLLLLLYNAHILWSCRALERHYSIATAASNGSSSNDSDNTVNHSPLQYLRVVVSVGVWETLLEIGLSRYFLRALSPSTTPDPPSDTAAATDTTSASSLHSLQPEQSATYDSPLMRSLRKKIRHRTMGVSLSMLSTAVLMIYRFQFPHVGTPVLPWLPLGDRWLHLNPILSHLTVLFLLHHISVAATGDPATVWVALGCGNFVGMLWGAGWLDCFAEAYWGNGVLLVAVALTVLSLKARSPYAAYLLWIDRVGWNERGNVLLYDSSLDRYVEAPVQRFPVDVDAAGSDSGSDDSLSNVDDEDDEDDETGRAFPSTDDSEIYGRLPSLTFMEMGQLGDANDDGSEGDYNNETTRLITPSSTGNSSQTSHFRSRRMNSAAPSDAEDWGR